MILWAGLTKSTVVARAQGHPHRLDVRSIAALYPLSLCAAAGGDAQLHSGAERGAEAIQLGDCTGEAAEEAEGDVRHASLSTCLLTMHKYGSGSASVN